MIDPRRIRILRAGEPSKGPVIYAMSRDQRAGDNWALLYAQELALQVQQPLIVACPMAADYPRLPQRQADFMMDGLRQVETRLVKRGIPFAATPGPAVPGLLKLAGSLKAGALVTDFNPLKESQKWKADLTRRLRIPFFEVDAHNIIPCWDSSDKQEYAAYTIRPKIKKRLAEFLTPFPRPAKHPFALELNHLPAGWSGTERIKTGKSSNSLFNFRQSGETAARKRMQLFLSERLSSYNDLRNNPVASGQSDLSPYLHFGQISAQRVALEAQRYDDDLAAQESFLEELIVRRELSDNFCFYNNRYDSVGGFPAWARTTLDDHRGDPRPYLYDRDTLEAGTTHDELWNAAQLEMVVTGKMHGYMRMYWAKKILEWVVSPEEALAHAIYLNDKYELDGHDPNGYTGIAWSIGGVHDRAWPERDIFGKVRFMSLGGCRRKFRVNHYIERVARQNSEVTA